MPSPLFLCPAFHLTFAVPIRQIPLYPKGWTKGSDGTKNNVGQDGNVLNAGFLMGKFMRILIVEDSKFFIQLVSKAIAESIRAETVVATSLAEARQIIAESVKPFDLALTDIMLPDDETGEAVSLVLDHNIPCIVFTAIFSEDLRERLLARNVIDYVVKNSPASLDYLMGLVTRLHRNRLTKVMVVDDSQTTRNYLRDLLHAYQFKVIEAVDAEDALQKLKTTPGIRMIITDYHMPGMDGVEMVRRIRVNHDQDRLCIIGLSSGGGSALSAQFIKMGANDFINKPFLREEFFCRVMQNMRMLDMVERLTDLATKDALTGIHNRRFFFDAGDALFASAKRDHVTLTAAMIDIDFFKQINDSFGHDAGDAVLKKVASVMRGKCRQTDLVARFGGEEFAILAVNMDESAAATFFESLRAAIEAENFSYRGKSLKVSISIGICRGAGDTLSAMIKAADEMLYKAKKNGRNRIEML